VNKTEFREKLKSRGFNHRFELIEPDHNYDYEYAMGGFVVCMVGYITSIFYEDQVDLHYHTQDYDMVYNSLNNIIREMRIKKILK